MTVEKCKIRLSRASKLCGNLSCDTLISKELHVMVCLINEEFGLRVSDIHSMLGGNKSWVSHLCSKLIEAGLASSKRDGREFYYKLTEHGKNVAAKALALIDSLIETANIDFVLNDNTYLLDPNAILGKKPQKLWKPIVPLYTHKGAVLYNKTEQYFFFIGTDRNGRTIIIEFPLTNLLKIDYGFDNYYKRRYAPRTKPLIIEFSNMGGEELTIQKIYLFIKFHKIGRTTKNSKWFTMFIDEISQMKEKEETSPILESEKDVPSTVSNVGE